ncbi:hypothetical protein BGW80DRAFT_1460272 [Lactifluus volemus]|nr:hypothetical protein BGW80DRAFT_1460272 [Lactifluus volemus]
MSPSSILSLLPLAIKNKDVILAEHYISAAAVAMLVYDYLLTVGDEIRYIWKPPTTNVKVFYLLLRYGVVIAEIMCCQALSGLVIDMTHTVGIYLSVLMPRLNYPLAQLLLDTDYSVDRRKPVPCDGQLVYTLWDHRKAILRTLYTAYAISVCASVAFVFISIKQLLPNTIYDPYIFHMCLIKGRSPYWIGIWISQASFDIFLFILTICNAANRPRRANVKLITDLRRDGCIFYLALFGKHCFYIGGHVFPILTHSKVDAL